MNTSAQPKSTVSHPEKGHRYTIEELRELALRGNAWAMSQVDQWELEYGNEYAGVLSEKCTDPECEGYGEPVDFCCGENGELIDVDHGDWGHAVGWARAA
ncbi:hypothetical protein BJ994_000361 [Arthrobacter pigmenti]|uniref:Uncharacterized protein n=1 Tax=Arthrobacter pigmenti TaxID=271432 RepID=A0A846RN94_9MICC|nr:hypothetical protein [Arthrobacter pigmenti]NJC21285.1 hypothetical protein [Arthrobacter pigmenti]